MRCSARKWVASVLLLVPLLARTSSSLAYTDSPWALGGQVVLATTRFGDGIQTIGPGLRGSVLAHLAPKLWVGAEVAAYAWVQPAGTSYAEPVGGLGTLDRGFQAGAASLVLHAGPQWRYRPYWVLALSVEQQTSSASVLGPKQMERVPAWGVGLGTRGNRGVTPWLEWRWHQSFGSMSVLGSRRLVYHTLGVGVGWN